MGKRIFDLSGIITVDGLQGAVKGLKAIDQSFKQAEKALVKFGRQTVHAGTTLTKNITLPITALGTVVTKFGADFEKSMSTSLAIMGNVSGEMRDKMEKVAIDVSKTTTFSANSAAKAYFYLASAGLDATQSVTAMPKVAKFAQAGMFDLALATDLLTDAQSALGLTIRDDVVKNIENMTRVSDVLVKANVLANATVQQFSESLTNKAGAALKVLGKDIEEGVAVLAAFADQGVKGAEGGTQFAIVLRDLQRSSIENRKAFDAAGISVYDASGEMRNMADIISELEKRFSSMSDEQKRSELMTLGFNDKSVQATMALIGTSNAIREYEKQLRSAAGTTEDVSQRQLKNFWSQLQILGNRLTAVGINLYGTLQPILMNQIIPALEKAASKVERLASWFNSLDDSTKRNVIGILAITAAIGPFLFVLGKTILAIKSVAAALTIARTAFLSLTVAMTANPFVMVTVGVVALAAGLWGAKKAYDNLIASHKKYTLLTTDQVKIKAFISSVVALTDKMNSLGDKLNEEEVINKELGDSVTELTDKARELGYVVEGNNKEKIDSLLLIDAELRGLRDATGALIKYTAAKKESAQTTSATGSPVVKKTEEELKAIEKLNKESLDRIAAATLDKDALYERELAQAIEHAKKIGADVKLVEQAFLSERLADHKKELEEKAKEEDQRLKEKKDLETEWTRNLLDQAGDRLKIIENERRIAVDEARKKGVAVEQVNKFFDNERRKAERELKQERFRDILDTVAFYVDSIAQIGSGIAGLFQQSSLNKQIALDNQQQKERDVINNSLMSERDKRRAIEALDIKQDKQQRELRRKAAAEGKRIAIFDSIIGTASAVINALGSVVPPLNFVFAGIVGAIGAAKTALISAQPLPLAAGAVVRKRSGGLMAQIAEGNEDEAVIPLKTGVRAIAQNLLSLMRESFASTVPSPFAMAGVGGYQPVQQNHWHIGVLVADDRGIKELERRQLPFRTQEAQRKGQMA